MSRFAGIGFSEHIEVADGDFTLRRGMKPVIMRIVVDFPAVRSEEAEDFAAFITVKETPLTATFGPKRFFRFSDFNHGDSNSVGDGDRPARGVATTGVREDNRRARSFNQPRGQGIISLGRFNRNGPGKRGFLSLRFAGWGIHAVTISLPESFFSTGNFHFPQTFPECGPVCGARDPPAQSQSLPICVCEESDRRVASRTSTSTSTSTRCVHPLIVIHRDREF